MCPRNSPEFPSYIDRPIVTGEGNLMRLRETWDSYAKETSTWSQWGLKEFRNEFEQVESQHDVSQ